MFILAFIITLSLLVVVHEFGHFILAKLSGVRVEKFALGFGKKKLISLKKGETEYSVRPFPLGGFVKMSGEDEYTATKKEKKDPKSFISKPIYKRASVVFAGPFFNFLLAFLVFFGVYATVGMPVAVETEENYIEVSEILEGSAADKAGVEIGDKIISISSGKEVLSGKLTEDFRDFVVAHSGQKVSLEILRDSEKLFLEAVPDRFLGVLYGEIEIIKQPFYMAAWYSAKDVAIMSGKTLESFWIVIVNAFNGGDLFKELRGVVGIAEMSGEAASAGFLSWLSFLALISINLAVLNLLPIPILDGGHLLFLGIEKLKGSPVGEKIRNYANYFGITILLCIMLLATYNDVYRLIFG